VSFIASIPCPRPGPVIRSPEHAHAIAATVDEQELRDDYIIPSVFNRDVAPAVAAAVADEARAAGTARAGHEVGFAQGDTMTGSSSSAQMDERA